MKDIGGVAGYRPRVRSAYYERVYVHSPRRDTYDISGSDDFLKRQLRFCMKTSGFSRSSASIKLAVLGVLHRKVTREIGQNMRFLSGRTCKVCHDNQKALINSRSSASSAKTAQLLLQTHQRLKIEFRLPARSARRQWRPHLGPPARLQWSHAV